MQLKTSFNILKATGNKKTWLLKAKLNETKYLCTSKLSDVNFLFAYYPHDIPDSQIYPFYYFKQELEEMFGLKLGRVNIFNFIKKLPGTYPKIKYICIQTWFDIPQSESDKLFEYIKNGFPNAKIIYLDWFAPTDLRLAETIAPYIDLYVKKNTFSNLTDYHKNHYGDTNLDDYYSQLYKIQKEKMQYRIPDGFLEKVVTGPSFITGPYLEPLFSKSKPDLKDTRAIDLHARLAFKGSDWYCAMRKASIGAVDTISNFNIASEGKISFKKYLKELSLSKLTFSPFGYGEVCWRDFEAIALGSLLIKPDMSHMLTEPDIYIPGETYIPIKWDFSDLKDKVEYYLSNITERRRIVENAFELGHDYYQNKKFLNFVEKIL